MTNNIYRSGGQRRLIFTGNVKTSLFSKYKPGQGIGGLNTSVRRAKYRKAASTTFTMTELDEAHKIKQSTGQGPRPITTCGCTFNSNPSNLAFPY